MINELTNHGLTIQESRAYVALLKLKESKTGKLCKVASIAPSHIYPVLDSLITKGLVNFKKINNVKVFMASTPEVLNDLLESRRIELSFEEERLKKLIPQLKSLTQISDEQEYKYFQGIKGVKAMRHEINEIMTSKNPIRAYTAKQESYKWLEAVYHDHSTLRKKKGVKELLIFPEEERNNKNKSRDKFNDFKFTTLKNEAEWGVVEDTFYLQYLVGKEPRAFMIHDTRFAETFRQVFDQLWAQAKK